MKSNLAIASTIIGLIFLFTYPLYAQASIGERKIKGDFLIIKITKQQSLYDLCDSLAKLAIDDTVAREHNLSAFRRTGEFKDVSLGSNGNLFVFKDGSSENKDDIFFTFVDAKTNTAVAFLYSDIKLRISASSHYADLLPGMLIFLRKD